MYRAIIIAIVLLSAVWLGAQVPQGRIYSVGKITSGFTNSPIRMISCDNNYFYAVQSDSSLYQYVGNHGYTPVPPGNDFTFVTGNYMTALAIRTDGSLAAWGDNSYGQCDVPTGSFIHAGVGYGFCVAVRADGSLIAWGRNDLGQCEVPAGDDFAKVFCNLGYSVALTSQGETEKWGSDPQFYFSWSFENVKKLVFNGSLTMVLYNTGVLHQWQVHSNPLTIPGSYSDVALTNYTLLLRTDGSLAAAGNSAPTNLPTGNNFVSVAASTSGGFAFALNDAGEVHAINNNIFQNLPGDDYIQMSAEFSGLLGLKADGSLAVAFITNVMSPLTIPAGNDFTAVSMGYYHAMALRSNGTIIAWGSNYFGQCNVPAGNDFVAISAGGSQSLALRSNGTVVCWGDHDNDMHIVPPYNDFVRIEADFYRNLAIRSDGTLCGWGSNTYGVGNIPAGNEYVDIACGQYFSMALKADGSVITWGRHQESNPPGNDYVKIAAGRDHYVCLRSDGTIYSWSDYTYEGACEPPAGDAAYIDVAAGFCFSAFLKQMSPTPVTDEVLTDDALQITAYPNPGRQNSLISFQTDLKARETGSLSIYNLKGQKVKSLSVNPATNLTLWNGRNSSGAYCAAGIYFYKYQAGGRTLTRKLLLLK